MRRKSSYKTSKAAWMDISSKEKIKPSDVKAKHSTKAWIWIPKKSSKFTLMKPGENKKGKIIKNKSKKSKSKKNTRTVTTSRKDFEMCKNIDNALKDKHVKKIIINK